MTLRVLFLGVKNIFYAEIMQRSALKETQSKAIYMDLNNKI